MTQPEILVDSREVKLTSTKNIVRSPTIIASDATYKPDKGMSPHAGVLFPREKSETDLQEELSGPYAMVYVTKVMNRTPDDLVKKILENDADREIKMRNNDFFTFLLNTSIQVDDPTSTRLEYAKIEFDFSDKTKILEYTPKEQSISVKIINTGGNEISISPSLGISASGTLSATTSSSDTQKNSFDVKVGPSAEIKGSYSKKDGYTIEVPTYNLLEYRGFQKNEREVNWEMYENNLIKDDKTPGRGKIAVFSVITQSPRDISPDVKAHVSGRVTKKVLFFDFEGSIHYSGGNVPQAT